MCRVIEVRVADGRDVETLFDLRTGVRENRLSRLQLGELGITPEGVAASLETDACAWIAELGGKPAGFAMALAPERSLFALFVRPDCEGRGVGSARTMAQVRAVFLHEPDEAQLVANYRAREPASGEQHKRAEVSRLYGEWLVAEAKRLCLVTLPARAWHTTLERIGLAVEGAAS